MSERVAAVVVAYASADVLPQCLASLRGQVAETVVVCNDHGASAPAALREQHPDATWIDNPSNRGFAAAVNQGVAATTAPVVLLFNPDCELRSGVGDLADACQRVGVAGAGGLLLDQGGAPQAGFFARSLPTPAAMVAELLGLNRVWPGNPVNRRYRLLDLDPSEECEVGQPAGAFLALRRDALIQVGGFDEAFHPCWWEDVDLCRRLSNAGYSLVYVPRAAATHAGGHAVGTLALDASLQAWYGGLMRYVRKHLARRDRRGVESTLIAGLALRGLFFCLAKGRPDTAVSYLTFLHGACSGSLDRDEGTKS